ncbi:hypothetical protein CCO03_15155 [Comamonas serinivorans]|uniref:YcaO domain-containing protein n=1 Tax=Comamonas serinivorans TaxID=1082851 RepID=A0A1Y0EU70_9BURK|nr:hypothetical protein CCO03_15155 [Comamonas serinivorans]
MAGLANWAVPADPAEAWQTVSGAVGWGDEAARAGAIAEGLERLAAAQVPLPLRTRASLAADAGASWLDVDDFALFSPAQREAAGFPWPMRSAPGDLFAEVHRLRPGRLQGRNSPVAGAAGDSGQPAHAGGAVPTGQRAGAGQADTVWVPQELVGLGPRQGVARLPSTSSGLAAHRDGVQGPWLALLRALQELLERDALTVTWLHGLGGQEIAVPAHWQARAARLGGELRAFNLTQAWNPQRVVAVAGGAPQQGQPRWVLGVACRASVAEALEKAALEWAQSLAFAGYMLRERAHRLPREAARLRRFDEHAAFYSLRPDLWPQWPLLRHAQPCTATALEPSATWPGTTPAAATRVEWIATPAVAAQPATAAAAAPIGGAGGTAQAQVEALVQRLHQAGIELLYRELTTRDVAAAGVRVMRAVSPQLAQLHADERAPFLGGRTSDWRWRYPQAQPHGPFPNPLPHPLG